MAGICISWDREHPTGEVRDSGGQLIEGVTSATVSLRAGDLATAVIEIHLEAFKAEIPWDRVIVKPIINIAVDDPKQIPDALAAGSITIESSDPEAVIRALQRSSLVTRQAT